MKIPPVSASAAEETTFCRVLQMTLDGDNELRAPGGGVSKLEDAGDATA